LLSFAVVNVKDVGECQIVLCIGRDFAPFPSKEAHGYTIYSLRARSASMLTRMLAIDAWSPGRGERGEGRGVTVVVVRSRRVGEGSLARREKHAKRGRLAQDEACLLVERGQTNEAEGTSLSLFL
ncbi:hypothetical protein ALC53_11616, partial [Atta colombica]